MITKFVTLIRRELWEHASIRRLPLVLIALGLLANLSLSGLSKWLKLFPTEVSGSIVDGSLRTIAVILFVIFSIVAIFYLIDSLHSERKDKSILFWRSLPISDTAAVLSKLVVAIVVIPLMLWITIIIVQTSSLAIQWLISDKDVYTVAEGTRLALPDLNTLIGYWLTQLRTLVFIGLWTLPFMCWLLFCSSWTSRTPFLAVIGIPVALVFVDAMFELNLGLSGLFAERLPFGRTLIDVFGEGQTLLKLGELSGGVIRPNAFSDAGRYFREPALWIGFVVSAIFITATVWIRRWRDDS